MKNIAESVSLDESIYSSKKNSLDALCKQKEIIQFMNAHGLKRDDMDDYWLELLNYAEDYPNCKNCTGLKNCPKKLVGYKRKLDYVDDIVTVVVEACDYQKMFEDEESVNSRIITNLPRRLLNIKGIDFNQVPQLLAKEIYNYTSNFNLETTKQKGLYIFGPSQTCKTIMMGYLAKVLAKKGYSVVFMNVPVLMSQLKSSFNDEEENTSNILYRLKEADILILDDLGGENYSNWSRDEILGSLIEERLLSEKPIVYTSVYDHNDLLEYYSGSNNKVEHMKVSKIVNKIISNTHSVNLYE